MKVRPIKTIAAGLSVTLFTTNVLLAHSPETNFWKERRKESIQVAQLPSAFLPSPLPSLKDLPPITKAGSSISKQIKKTLSPSQINEFSPLVAALAPSYGSVRKISAPKTCNTHKTVIQIQDVHLNPEAQENMGQAVQQLIDEKKIHLVALEGAFEPIDFSVYRNDPYQESVKAVANYLLREKKISGVVHTAFVSPTSIPPIIGVDQKTHYDANIKAYKQSAPVVKNHQEIITSQQKELTQLKNTRFNKKLLDFDQSVMAYHQGTLSWGDYVRTLARYSLETTHNIDVFLAALDQEQKLNFTRVEQERTSLLKSVVSKLSESQSKDLVDYSTAYRVGTLSHSDFYEYLKQLCETHQVSLRSFPAMDDYIRYVLLSDSIQVDHVLKDAAALENKVYASLAATSEEKELILVGKKLALTQKLLTFSLTREEWEEYKAVIASDRRERSNLHLPEMEPASLLSNADRFASLAMTDLSSFEHFYTEALARDTAMTENLLSAMDKTQAKVAVLVTGGFHSAGMEKILNEKGIATITYAPKISKIDDENGSNYLNVFTQEKTPLDQLFAGEKLFVTPPPMVAEAPFMGLTDAHHKAIANRAETGIASDGDVTYSVRVSELTGGIISATVRVLSARKRFLKRLWEIIKKFLSGEGSDSDPNPAGVRVLERRVNHPLLIGLLPLFLLTSCSQETSSGRIITNLLVVAALGAIWILIVYWITKQDEWAMEKYHLRANPESQILDSRYYHEYKKGLILSDENGTKTVYLYDYHLYPNSPKIVALLKQGEVIPNQPQEVVRDFELPHLFGNTLYVNAKTFDDNYRVLTYLITPNGKTLFDPLPPSVDSSIHRRTVEVSQVDGPKILELIPFGGEGGRVRLRPGRTKDLFPVFRPNVAHDIIIEGQSIPGISGERWNDILSVTLLSNELVVETVLRDKFRHFLVFTLSESGLRLKTQWRAKKPSPDRDGPASSHSNALFFFPFASIGAHSLESNTGFTFDLPTVFLIGVFTALLVTGTLIFRSFVRSYRKLFENYLIKRTTLNIFLGALLGLAGTSAIAQSPVSVYQTPPAVTASVHLQNRPSYVEKAVSQTQQPDLTIDLKTREGLQTFIEVLKSKTNQTTAAMTVAYNLFTNPSHELLTNFAIHSDLFLEMTLSVKEIYKDNTLPMAMRVAAINLRDPLLGLTQTMEAKVNNGEILMPSLWSNPLYITIGLLSLVSGMAGLVWLLRKIKNRKILSIILMSMLVCIASCVSNAPNTETTTKVPDRSLVSRDDGPTVWDGNVKPIPLAPVEQQKLSITSTREVTPTTPLSVSVPSTNFPRSHTPVNSRVAPYGAPTQAIASRQANTSESSKNPLTQLGQNSSAATRSSESNIRPSSMSPMADKLWMTALILGGLALLYQLVFGALRRKERQSSQVRQARERARYDSAVAQFEVEENYSLLSQLERVHHRTLVNDGGILFEILHDKDESFALATESTLEGLKIYLYAKLDSNNFQQHLLIDGTQLIPGTEEKWPNKYEGIYLHPRGSELTVLLNLNSEYFLFTFPIRAGKLQIPKSRTKIYLDAPQKTLPDILFYPGFFHNSPVPAALFHNEFHRIYHLGTWSYFVSHPFRTLVYFLRKAIPTRLKTLNLTTFIILFLASCVSPTSSMADTHRLSPKIQQDLFERPPFPTKVKKQDIRYDQQMLLGFFREAYGQSHYEGAAYHFSQNIRQQLSTAEVLRLTVTGLQNIAVFRVAIEAEGESALATPTFFELTFHHSDNSWSISEPQSDSVIYENSYQDLVDIVIGHGYASPETQYIIDIPTQEILSAFKRSRHDNITAIHVQVKRPNPNDIMASLHSVKIELMKSNSPVSEKLFQLLIVRKLLSPHFYQQLLQSLTRYEMEQFLEKIRRLEKDFLGQALGTSLNFIYKARNILLAFPLLFLVSCTNSSPADLGANILWLFILASVVFVVWRGLSHDPKSDRIQIKNLARAIKIETEKPTSGDKTLDQVLADIRQREGGPSFDLANMIRVAGSSEQEQISFAVGLALAVKNRIGDIFKSIAGALNRTSESGKQNVTLFFIKDPSDLGRLRKAKASKKPADIFVIIITNGINSDLSVSVAVEANPDQNIFLTFENELPDHKGQFKFEDLFTSLSMDLNELHNPKGATIFEELAADNFQDKTVTMVGTSNTPYLASEKLLAILKYVIPLPGGELLLLNINIALHAAKQA